MGPHGRDLWLNRVDWLRRTAFRHCQKRPAHPPQTIRQRTVGASLSRDALEIDHAPIGIGGDQADRDCVAGFDAMGIDACDHWLVA